MHRANAQLGWALCFARSQPAASHYAPLRSRTCAARRRPPGYRIFNKMTCKGAQAASRALLSSPHPNPAEPLPSPL
eukprot:12455775-Alexandrium_andersonii.AAC.1